MFTDKNGTRAAHIGQSTSVGRDCARSRESSLLWLLGLARIKAKPRRERFMSSLSARCTVRERQHGYICGDLTTDDNKHTANT